MHLTGFFRTKFRAEFRGHFHPDGSWCRDGPQWVHPRVYQYSTELHWPLWSISVRGGIYPRLDDDYVLTLFFKSLVVRMSLQTETPRSRETPLWLLLAPIYYIAFICCYRFYIDIGIASLVLLITLCFAFGLLCGCCGKRPVDRYDDDFGTRATGASCLMS
jgi:hypothetical protein